MATQPSTDNPGDTPVEFPAPTDPGAPGGPDESPVEDPNYDQPDSAPVELPPPD